MGTRNSSNLGKVIAEQLGSELSNLGCVVVSGLAQGIDTCAHMGSVKAAAPAIAILGTEPNTVTPTANKSLANQIVDLDGALLTEVHPGQETNRYKFIQRNRIQAGISKFLFVVEMGIAGGTMHTVRFAKKYRKPIFVPRPIYEAQTFESNAGIKALVDSGDAQAFGLRDLPDIINGSYPISQRHVSSGDQLSLM